jgi:hypothetical protein
MPPELQQHNQITRRIHTFQQALAAYAQHQLLQVFAWSYNLKI